MGLISSAVADATRERPPRCPVARVLARFDADDRDEFVAAIASPDVQHVTIERALRSDEVLAHYGHDLPRAGHKAIATHRQGACSCQA